ncbi:MAG: hydantoinase/oxoprolinase family protein [Candidatus Abyssobacteria bacterium SURF_5]|uniref:Hydantoinase/oxoprolinase family protein n=1 Tax=Abyssobacteria bacterium (strain SURF_5) TaxID=2093360 RepID=A0A3A4N593_ABYX5|nr:MAG: hydantoinase/oxoprolinase family protein [Candidatus Abyssubacteria bacterium SURF_5]
MRVVGIDTGGTFTDLVLAEGGTLKTKKVPSTPRDPAEALLTGLRLLCEEDGGAALFTLTHGSTVATNSLLERKGATVALITTAGFEDVLLIGRQQRPSLYDLNVEKPAPLIRRENIFGVRERILHDGTVESRPDEREIQEIAQRIMANRCDSIAVCFLHAYRNFENEEFVERRLENLKIPICSSHRVLPEYREYERISTTSVNAFVAPKMDVYIRHIEENISTSSRLRIMQSNGGAISASRARAEAVQTILSGPAAGVVGAFEAARAAGFDKVITFDMGGTSTDVSLCDKRISTRTSSNISGVPIATPVVDIHTVGAGGGSIAWLDSAGSLRVGPKSAGAEPGPVCYGVGSELTVTDANLFLGRMAAERFLGGEMSLDLDRVQYHMLKFSNDLGMSAEQAAEGVLAVANATMERAIRVISVERGHDPRHFTLIAFGGAGPMHACSLACALGIPQIIIPHNAGVLSALGLLMADVKKDLSQTVLIRAEQVDIPRLNQLFAPLEKEAQEIMAGEGFAPNQFRLDGFLDMRYAGQAYEVTVPVAEDFVAIFHQEHFRLYGHSDASRAVELVNIRLTASGIVEPPPFIRGEETDIIAEAAFLGDRQAVFASGVSATPVYDRAELRPGNQLAGPAIVAEAHATTVITPGFTARMDVLGNILIKPAVSA